MRSIRRTCDDNEDFDLKLKLISVLLTISSVRAPAHSVLFDKSEKTVISLSGFPTIPLPRPYLKTNKRAKSKGISVPVLLLVKPLFPFPSIPRGLCPACAPTKVYYQQQIDNQKIKQKNNASI